MTAPEQPPTPEQNAADREEANRIGMEAHLSIRAGAERQHLLAQRNAAMEEAEKFRIMHAAVTIERDRERQEAAAAIDELRIALDALTRDCRDPREYPAACAAVIERFPVLVGEKLFVDRIVDAALEAAWQVTHVWRAATASPEMPAPVGAVPLGFPGVTAAEFVQAARESIAVLRKQGLGSRDV